MNLILVEQLEASTVVAKDMNALKLELCRKLDQIPKGAQKEVILQLRGKKLV